MKFVIISLLLVTLCGCVTDRKHEIRYKLHEDRPGCSPTPIKYFIEKR